MVWVVAALASLLHLAPYWHAASQVPAGWIFTGEINGSPDVMQYRVWTRRSQETGVLVDNRFTGEANKPHLPVIFYYAIGKISGWFNTSPEFVVIYLGSVFAFGLIILLFATVRHFMSTPYQTWWVFLAIVVGGGLGAHLKILNHLDVGRYSYVLNQTIIEGFRAQPVFEDYRSHYVFITLFDTHFLLIWLVALAAILSFYFTLRRFSLGRAVVTGVLYAVATLLHVYEGVTLVVVAAAVGFVCWRKGFLLRPALVTTAVCALFVVGSMAWLLFLYRSSGLPPPSWRGWTIPMSTLLIAYPLAWLMMAFGLGEYWRKAKFDECFLLGWALGCTALTLSGPFYPYPDRGTMTMQVPISIIAGAIYFARYSRVTWVAGVVAFLVLGATPVVKLSQMWLYTTFNPNLAYMFMNNEHREIIELLGKHAKENDLLVVDKSDEPWKTDDLWLAPNYPGKLYCGHFFLTVNYDQKRAALDQFFDSGPEERARFLNQERIRFVYVNAKKNPKSFETVPGIVLLKAASVGSLFEYFPQSQHAFR
jgi:hypothetical protein